MSLISTVFVQCVSAVRSNILIERTDRHDKEYHCQNWFKSCLDDLGEHYDDPRRNAYPDFKIVRHPEGYELKGLAYPGQTAYFDCNSRPPGREHNGRQVYYVFGRYPARPFNLSTLDFLVRNRAKLRRIHRIGMIYMTLDRMSKEQKQVICEDSVNFF